MEEQYSANPLEEQFAVW